MKIKYIAQIALAVLLTGAVMTSSAAEEKKTQKELKAEAKVTKKEAKAIALAKVPGGKVKEAELEEEKGKLIWSFDITTEGSKDIMEVAVDAKTGEVVSVEKETPEDQAKEKAADAKEAKEKKEKKD